MAMPIKERQSFLAELEFFARCKKRDIKALARSCEERSYDPGQALCRQGERGIAMFLITRGTVRVESHTDDGRTVELAQLGPGSAVGELALLDGAERTASVIAHTPVDALVLTDWKFSALLRARPVVALDILPVVISRFRETAAQLRASKG